MPEENLSEQPQDAPGSDLRGTMDTSNVVIKKQSRAAEFLFKSFAVFIISSISAIGVGALIGVDPWKTIVIAGVIGLLRIVESVAKGYLDDGQVTLNEIDSAFKYAGDQADSTNQ